MYPFIMIHEGYIRGTYKKWKQNKNHQAITAHFQPAIQTLGYLRSPTMDDSPFLAVL